MDELWSAIPDRLIEWKPTAKQVWDKGSEQREAARFEAVEICLPSFVPIFVAVERGRKELWKVAVAPLRQLVLLRERMLGGHTGVENIGSHMLYIAGSLGMAIAVRTKQLDFVNSWMRLPMPARRYGQAAEIPWAETKHAHRWWGNRMPCGRDASESFWQICQSDYLLDFFGSRELLEKHLLMGNLAQSLYELSQRTGDYEFAKALKARDVEDIDPSTLRVWPVWAIMEPNDFESAVWDLFETSAGVFGFVSPHDGISLGDFWAMWKGWKDFCVRVMENELPQISEELILPGEPQG